MVNGVSFRMPVVGLGAPGRGSCSVLADAWSSRARVANATGRTVADGR